jgi:hypothetical protein
LLHRPSGEPCEATVTGFAVLRGVTPHFSEAEEWESLGDRATLESVWGEASDRILVAELDGAVCDDALWASKASQPVVRYEQIEDPDQTADLLRAFRKMPFWPRTQHWFAANGGKGAWDDDEGAQREIRLFRHPGTGSRWAYVYAEGGDEECGHAADREGVLLERTATGWVGRSVEPGEMSIRAAYDLDGDGVPEFLADGVVFARDSSGDFKMTHSFSYPYHDCDC